MEHPEPLAMRHLPLASAGHALSFNTRQLNLENTIHGFTGNQLDLLHGAGYLTNTPAPPNPCHATSAG